jgi:uncharacterized protein (TIGR03435 family)
MGVPWEQRDTLIAGGPDWINSEGFNVEAKAESASTHSELQSMLQQLLADEFNLTFHREKKEMRVLALVVAKGGPKLKLAQVDSRCGEKNPRACPGMRAGNLGFAGRSQSMSALAASMTLWMRQTVIDKTGLTGLYDFDTGPARPENPGGAPNNPAEPQADPDTLPTIFTALQDKLGLRLEPQKAEADIIVVDSASKPN